MDFRPRWGLMLHMPRTERYSISTCHRIQEKSGREKTDRLLQRRVVPAVLLWLHDLWLTAEELCTRLHETKGAQDSSWDEDKKNSKGTNSHTPPPLRYQRRCLHSSISSSLRPVIPLMLSQGLFFVVVRNAASVEFKRLCCRRGGGGGGGGFLFSPSPLSLIFSSPRSRFFQLRSP